MSSASVVFTNTENQKQRLQKVNTTALHRDPCGRSLLGCCVWGGSAVPLSGDQAQGLAQPSSLYPCCEHHQESFSPSQPRAAAQGQGELMACPVCAQVPGAEQGGGGARQLYRARVSTRRRGRSRARQERPVPRPVPRGRAHGPEVLPGRRWGWGCPHTWPGLGCFPCCPKLCPIPGVVFVLFNITGIHLLLG